MGISNLIARPWQFWPLGMALGLSLLAHGFLFGLYPHIDHQGRILRPRPMLQTHLLRSSIGNKNRLSAENTHKQSHSHTHSAVFSAAAASQQDAPRHTASPAQSKLPSPYFAAAFLSRPPELLNPEDGDDVLPSFFITGQPLRFLLRINADGSVDSVASDAPEEYHALVEDIKTHLMKWVFVPGEIDKRPVATELQIEIGASFSSNKPLEIQP